MPRQLIEQARAYMDAGMTGWWTDPNLVMAYFRPVTVLTHVVDYALWPDSPARAAWPEKLR